MAVMLKFYQYKPCSTCREARKWLNSQSLRFEDYPIRDTPPSLEELVALADVYGPRKLFNSSGIRYRELSIKDKISSLSDTELLQILAGDGHLVKRPILFGEYGGRAIRLVGFKVAEWRAAFGH